MGDAEITALKRDLSRDDLPVHARITGALILIPELVEKNFGDHKMLSFARSFIRPQRRSFSVILSTGEKAEREMTPVEREVVNIKEYQFSKLGLYKKKESNETTLYKLFQMAQPKVKSDYSACLYAINHFYNFGISLDHHELADRWLATAVETGRIDQAVELVKYWHTFLRVPPSSSIINVLVGMVKIEQSRELLKAIRENWNIPLSPYAYSILISKELGRRFTDTNSVQEAYIVWSDAVMMDVVLPEELSKSLHDLLLERSLTKEAEIVESLIQQQSTC